MKEFKIRASAIGTLMTGTIGLTDKQLVTLQGLEARNAGEGKPLTDNMVNNMLELQHKRDNPELPQTVKSYVDTWLKEQYYGRRKEFSNKFTIKGNVVEDRSIEYVAEQLFYDELQKNEEYFENDFIKGTPDMIPPSPSDEVLDVKNSWDCFTFPLFDTELKNADYWWQGQGYMALTGRSKYKVVYVLSNTPEYLIQKEADFYCRSKGYQKTDDEVMERFKSNMTYDDIDDSLRIKVFEFERDDKAIKNIEKRVVIVRNYIKEFLKQQKL
jgi:hypothetical protein